ncbi:hypothetical protein BDV96DRAFT_601315 [Lophiotrema nucula]|uniref:Uncharacterized protein n=1 Tax=Lophiotrema nucula TaxID=690887 RepID=A0A6A5Z352_9PLEO|nr:hypothetical protein BDV96DRAFT_601315 [Lophiotrema nucula]
MSSSSKGILARRDRHESGYYAWKDVNIVNGDDSADENFVTDEDSDEPMEEPDSDVEPGDQDNINGATSNMPAAERLAQPVKGRSRGRAPNAGSGISMKPVYDPKKNRCEIWSFFDSEGNDYPRIAVHSEYTTVKDITVHSKTSVFRQAEEVETWLKVLKMIHPKKLSFKKFLDSDMNPSGKKRKRAGSRKKSKRAASGNNRMRAGGKE